MPSLCTASCRCVVELVECKINFPAVSSDKKNKTGEKIPVKKRKKIYRKSLARASAAGPVRPHRWPEGVCSPRSVEQALSATRAGSAGAARVRPCSAGADLAGFWAVWAAGDTRRFPARVSGLSFESFSRGFRVYFFPRKKKRKKKKKREFSYGECRTEWQSTGLGTITNWRWRISIIPSCWEHVSQAPDRTTIIEFLAPSTNLGKTAKVVLEIRRMNR